MSLDFLLTEINKKKREIKEDSLYKGRKYVKTSELEEVRVQKYLEEQKLKEEEKLKKYKELLENNDQVEEEDEDLNKTLIILPREEVIQRLRARREPITLFGETDLLRAERLRKLELKEPMEYIEGVESIFNQTIREGSDDEEEASLLAKLMEQDPDFVIEDREPKNDQERVLFWCRAIFSEWEKALDARSEKDKKSSQGKTDTAILRETKSYLKPLMQMLTKNVVPDDIFVHVFKMYKKCKERNYKEAHNAYYSLAIGNAAWPMGVTMVGIHERSAREKISSNTVAHVLNDETQRKYITGFKRLLTRHQMLYPTIPSMSVM